MTASRQIFRDSTYLLTRSCTQQQFLLRPSDEVNEILRFCMIYAAQKFNIQIHAYCFMSNHKHVAATDPEGKLPRFEHWFNEFAAKCLNSLYGRWENLWASGQYNAVKIVKDTPEDILDKIVYILVNPVAAGQVESGYKWPGEWSDPKLMSNGYIEAKRPDFFSPTGVIPEHVRMELTPPPILPDKTPEEISEIVAERVRKKEDEIRRIFKAEGRKFAGAKSVKRQSHKTKPQTKKNRRKLRPRFACKDKKKRIQILEQYKEFLQEYRRAWKSFCNKERDVVFPAGTYKMRVFYGVSCKTRVQRIE